MRHLNRTMKMTTTIIMRRLAFVLREQLGGSRNLSTDGMVWNSKRLVAPAQRITMERFKDKSFHFEHGDWLHVQVPRDIPNILGQCLNHRVSELVKIAETVFRGHPFLILPACVISDHSLDFKDWDMRCQVTKELSDSMRGTIELRKESACLTGLDAMRESTVQHITEHRNNQFINPGRCVIIQN